MRALIIGASSNKSIGYHIGEHLRRKGDHIAYVSRSGSLGYRCNATLVHRIHEIIQEERPTLLIHAAGGKLLQPVALGSRAYDEWDWWNLGEHVIAKSMGSIVLLDAAVRAGSVKQFVALGGRTTFGDAKMAAYAVGNGALWSAIEFANQHVRQIKTYYLDLPIVIGTKNAEGLIAAGAHTADEHEQAIPVEKVLRTFDDIIADRIEPGRVML